MNKYKEFSIFTIVIFLLCIIFIITIFSKQNFTIVNKGEKTYPNQKWCICDTLGNVIKTK